MEQISYAIVKVCSVLLIRIIGLIVKKNLAHEIAISNKLHSNRNDYLWCIASQ